MSISNLQKDAIQQGQFPMAVLKENGLIRRLEPIQEVYQIEFSEFTKSQAKTFNLSSLLDKDYKIIALDFDLPDDGESGLQNSSTRPTNNQVYIEIRAFENQNVKKEYYYTAVTKSVFYADIFLNHQHDWQIKCSQNVQGITFYCVPIFLNKPIRFS